MEGAKLDKFFPLDLAWIQRVAADWDYKDAGPVFWVVFYLWPKGGRAPNDVKKLAKVAGVTPRAWAGIRARVGEFFREDAGDLVQDYMVGLYAEKLRTYLANKTKAENAIATRWKNPKGRAPSPSTTPGNTRSNTPSIPPGNTPGPVRADLLLDLKNSEREEERSNASAVPSVDVEAEITEALACYPTVRHLPNGGQVDVRFGEHDRGAARIFLGMNPGYPLALAARYTRKRDRMPPDFENWLENPPAADRVLKAYEDHVRARAADRAREYSPANPPALRAMVDEITTQAKRRPAHA